MDVTLIVPRMVDKCFPVGLKQTMWLWALITVVLGCSSGKQRLATEQLVMSDSVERSIAKIDFSPLEGQKCFLDTRYMVTAKTNSFVNPDYVISSLRQQMLAYDVRVVDKIEDAEVVVEARCGVLGSDGHDVSFGIPAGNNLGTTASTLSGYPMPPILPEISLIKRMDQLGATKVACFAYDKETREPVWQSGISTSISTAKDYWVFGVGPFQRGSIYGGTRFAGDPLKPFDPVALAKDLPDPVAVFRNELRLHREASPRLDIDSQVAPVGFTDDDREPGKLPAAPENLKQAPVPKQANSSRTSGTS